MKCIFKIEGNIILKLKKELWYWIIQYLEIKIWFLNLKNILKLNNDFEIKKKWFPNWKKILKFKKKNLYAV